MEPLQRNRTMTTDEHDSLQERLRYDPAAAGGAAAVNDHHLADDDLYSHGEVSDCESDVVVTGVKPGVLGQQSDDEALEVWDGPAHAGDAASVAEPRTPIGAGFREPSLLASLTNKRKGAQPYESGNSQIQKLPSLEDSDGDVVTAGVPAVAKSDRNSKIATASF